MQAAAGDGAARTSHSSASQGTSNIRRPASDSGRNFRFIRVPHNGMGWLLVHDPEAAATAAACVVVDCGYTDAEPSDPHGLAHFLEHAVMLGSSQFPGESEYKTYLAAHAGSSNASTSVETTTFHFQLNYTGLEGALARMGSFLASPLLLEDTASREVHAVDAEFKRNLNQDSRKLLQLKRSLLAPHPISWFSTGSLETLSGGGSPSTKDSGADRSEAGVGGGTVSNGSGGGSGNAILAAVPRLHALHSLKYHAGAMYGCVVAQQGLDELQRMVEAAFAGVPAAPAGAEEAARQAAAAGAMPAPGNAGLQTLVRVNPQREALRTLELRWLIPFSSRPASLCKPHRWVGHLLGHEGPGSLTAALREAGLLVDLTAGMDEEFTPEPGGFQLFSLRLELSEEGLTRVSELILAAHHHLALITAMNEGERRAAWEELAEITRTSWTYRDKRDPLALAKAAAHSAHHWPPEEILAGPALLQAYDGAAIDSFLQCLVPSRLTVVLVAKGGAAAGSVQRERWYHAQYTAEPLPQALVDACTAALSTPSSGPSPLTISLPPPARITLAEGPPPSLGHSSPLSLSRLSLPGRNWALPVQVDMPSSTVPAAQEKLQHPALLVDTPALRMWHLPQFGWGIPKAHVYVHLVTPHVYLGSLECWVAARLAARMLDLRLAERLYDARVLDTGYELHLVETGAILHLKGFTSILPRLLRCVLEGLQELGSLSHISDEASAAQRSTESHDASHQGASDFGLAVGKLMQLVKHHAHKSPAEHAAYEAESLLQEPHWHATHDVLPFLLHQYGSSNGRPAAGGADVAPATGTCDDNSQAGASEMDGSSDRSSKLDLRAGHARVAAWVSRLAECATANCLCVGSMSQQDAEQVAEVVRTTLGPRGLLPGQQVRVGVLNLAAAAAAATVSTAPATVVGNISRHEQPGNSADAAGQLVEVPEGQAQQMEQGQVHAKRRRVGEDAAPGSGAAAEPQQQDKWLAGVEMTKQSSSLDSGTHPSPRQDSASTQATSMLRLSLPSPNTSNSINSSVLLIVQVCDAHGPPESPALLELCVQLAAKPAFAALRTRQQLGYSVHLAAHRLHHRLGLKVSVQSARFPCGTVREAILSFLRDFSETLAGMPDDELSSHKRSLISRLREPPTSLSEAASLAWRPILRSTQEGAPPQFDRLDKLAGALEAGASRQDLCSFWVQYVVGACQGALCVEVSPVKPGAAGSAAAAEGVAGLPLRAAAAAAGGGYSLQVAGGGESEVAVGRDAVVAWSRAAFTRQNCT